MKLSEALSRLRNLTSNTNGDAPVQGVEATDRRSDVVEVEEAAARAVNAYGELIPTVQSMMAEDFDRAKQSTICNEAAQPGAMVLAVADKSGCLWGEMNRENADKSGIKVLKAFGTKEAKELVNAALVLIAGATTNEMLPGLALAGSDMPDREARLCGLNAAAASLSFAVFISHVLKDYAETEPSDPGVVYSRTLLGGLADKLDEAADKIRADFPNDKVTIN